MSRLSPTPGISIPARSAQAAVRHLPTATIASRSPAAFFAARSGTVSLGHRSVFRFHSIDFAMPSSCNPVGSAPAAPTDSGRALAAKRHSAGAGRAAFPPLESVLKIQAAFLAPATGRSLPARAFGHSIAQQSRNVRNIYVIFLYIACIFRKCAIMGPREAASMDRIPPAPARCGPTPIQPTGEVRPAPASCAGNQAREPRRRRHPPAPARKCAR